MCPPASTGMQRAPQHMLQFLQPFQGRLPQEEVEPWYSGPICDALGTFWNIHPIVGASCCTAAGQPQQASTTLILLVATCRQLQSNLRRILVWGRRASQRFRLGHAASRHYCTRRRWLRLLRCPRDRALDVRRPPGYLIRRLVRALCEINVLDCQDGGLRALVTSRTSESVFDSPCRRGLLWRGVHGPSPPLPLWRL